MKKQLLRIAFSMAVFLAVGSVNVKAAEVPVIDAQTALALQAQQQALIDAQNQALADAWVAMQQQQQAAIDAQNQAIANAIAAQQAAQQQAMAAQQAAQQQALEAVAAINAAAALVPQQDFVCDTNCADQNALLYSKTIPDFVLVDKSEQKVIFYRNGQRVLADSCVTGNESKGYSTTVGVHKIVFMDTNRTLRGSYGEAFVRYWMRFTSGGQGLHDAGWRNRFGETIYVTNGSHGCVNLTRNTAKTIYENAYVGLFVIVEN